MDVEESVVINRPLEEVFDYVADRENLPEWSSPVQEVRSETQGPLDEEGTRFTTVAKYLGRSFETSFEVIIHDPPHRHTDRSMGGPFPQEYTHIFEEVEGGKTRLTEVTKGEPGGFFRLVIGCKVRNKASLRSVRWPTKTCVRRVTRRCQVKAQDSYLPSS